MKRRNRLDDAGANIRREAVNISDLMVEDVVTTKPSTTVGKIRELMRSHKINAMPVVGPDEQPVGIVTSTDLLDGASDATRIDALMTRQVYTIPVYARIHDAARLMRNHHIHHLVVTNEKKIVGILSSFDLLDLVAGGRFVMKEASSRPKHGGGQRRRDEGTD